MVKNENRFLRRRLDIIFKIRIPSGLKMRLPNRLRLFCVLTNIFCFVATAFYLKKTLQNSKLILCFFIKVEKIFAHLFFLRILCFGHFCVNILSLIVAAFSVETGLFFRVRIINL